MGWLFALIDLLTGVFTSREDVTRHHVSRHHVSGHRKRQAFGPGWSRRRWRSIKSYRRRKNH